MTGGVASARHSGVWAACADGVRALVQVHVQAVVDEARAHERPAYLHRTRVVGGWQDHLSGTHPSCGVEAVASCNNDICHDVCELAALQPKGYVPPWKASLFFDVMMQNPITKIDFAGDEASDMCVPSALCVDTRLVS